MSFLAWFKRLFSFFLHLQWKLTVTYTLVTVAALSILLVVGIFIGNLLTLTYPQTTVMMAQALQYAARGLAPALEQNPPDTQALEDWIDQSYQDAAIFINNPDTETEYSISYTVTASRTTLLAVLDDQGRVLASNHSEQAPVGQLLPVTVPPVSLDLVQHAFDGERSLPQLMKRETSRHIIVSPILAGDGRLLGVILLVLNQPNQLEMLWITLVSILPMVLFLTVLAGMIGSAFGALTARGLTRRLKKAAQATNAWGKGDFSIRIQDRQRDEISQLACDLNRMADELQALMRTRQELAALEERNRLARELHDSTKQQVFATSMNLAAAGKLWDTNAEEARKRVDIAAELSRQSQQELTSLIQMLRPVELDQHSLGKALRDTVKAWEGQNNITATFVANGEERPLPSEVEQALFRVTQEALSNIARHSGANTVRVTLSLSTDAVVLQLEDNGCGFDPAQPARGLGLRSMQERMHAVGGNLNISSCAGKTHLTARVPLHLNREGIE